MKLTKLIFAIAVCMIFVVSIPACKKKDSYVCNCAYSDGTNNLTDSHDMGEKSSMSDAETECNTHKTHLLNSGAVSATCTVAVK